MKPGPADPARRQGQLSHGYLGCRLNGVDLFRFQAYLIIFLLSTHIPWRHDTKDERDLT